MPTLVIGNLNPDPDYLYAKSSNTPYVYNITPAFLSYISANPLHYKNRILERIPGNANIQSIRLLKIGARTPILDYSLPSQELSWEDALANENENKRKILIQLVSQLENVIVLDDAIEDFSPEGVLNQPWSYALEATTTLPGQETPETIKYEYYLSDRLSGQKQLGGSPVHDLSFYLNQD